MGGAAHQTCLALFSREAPPELGVLDGVAVHSFQLGGPEVAWVGLSAVQFLYWLHSGRAKFDPG